MSKKSQSLSSLRVPEKLVYEVMAAWEEAVEDRTSVYLSITRRMLPPRWPWPKGRERLHLLVDPAKPDPGANGDFLFMGGKGRQSIVGRLRLLPRPLVSMVTTTRHELGHMLQGIAHIAGVQGGYKVKPLRKDLRYDEGEDHYAGTDKSIPHRQRHIEYKTNLDSRTHDIIMGVQSKVKYNAPQSEIRSYVGDRVKETAEKAFGDLRTKKAQRMASELYTLVERGLNQRLGMRLNPESSTSGATHRLSVQAAEEMLSDAALTVSRLREEFLLAVTQRDRLRRRLKNTKAELHAKWVKSATKAQLAERALDETERELRNTQIRNEETVNTWRKIVREHKQEIGRVKAEAEGFRDEIEDLRKRLESATTAVQSAGLDKKALRQAQERSLRKQAKKQRRKGR